MQLEHDQTNIDRNDNIYRNQAWQYKNGKSLTQKVARKQKDMTI